MSMADIIKSAIIDSSSPKNGKSPTILKIGVVRRAKGGAGRGEEQEGRDHRRGTPTSRATSHHNFGISSHHSSFLPLCCGWLSRVESRTCRSREPVLRQDRLCRPRSIAPRVPTVKIAMSFEPGRPSSLPFTQLYQAIRPPTPFPPPQTFFYTCLTLILLLLTPAPSPLPRFHSVLISILPCFCPSMCFQ